VTVIAVLHDLNLATLFARRIVVMNAGRVAADGPPSATITEAVLARVFRVDATIGREPASGMPFVLPHGMTHAAD
jgi:iron complex transport system ATP-binding protein